MPIPASLRDLYAEMVLKYKDEIDLGYGEHWSTFMPTELDYLVARLSDEERSRFYAAHERITRSGDNEMKVFPVRFSQGADFSGDLF